MSELEPASPSASAPAPAASPHSYQQLEAQVRASFGCVYAALKAQELRTLRQLRVIRRQCEASHAHHDATACVHLVHLSCDEASMLAEVEKFGALDLNRLSVDGEAFPAEDYILPDEDHMYLYKCIEEVGDSELNIAEEALKRITMTEGCICSVRLTPEQVAQRFREEPALERKLKEELSKKDNETDQNPPCRSEGNSSTHDKEHSRKPTAVKTEEALVIEETVKVNPTEDWLNCIKSQTETEPSQVTDVMEHSTIVC